MILLVNCRFYYCAGINTPRLATVMQWSQLSVSAIEAVPDRDSGAFVRAFRFVARLVNA